MLDTLFLGAGIGYREVYQSDFFKQMGCIDFIEIIPEHFWELSVSHKRLLELLAAQYSVIPHAIGISFGSVEGLNKKYLKRIKEIIDTVNAPYWSEHIAFTQAGGYDIGHLAPVARTQSMLDVLCKNIDLARSIIHTPLILENITYEVNLPGNEFSDAEFLSLLVQKTGIGLLLDVTNLYTNAQNLTPDPDAFIEDFLSTLPTAAVVQLHLAGGHQEKNRWIDSHSAAVPEPVWELTAQVVARFPVKGIIIERDAKMPAFEVLVAEVHRARQLLDASRSTKPISAPIHRR